jgi:hypothetical protein
MEVLKIKISALSLRDLAQLVMCKELQRAYWERRAADEAWLAEAATSAFGARLVELLLNFLAQPWDKEYGWTRPSYDLVDGQSWPDPLALVSTTSSELRARVPSWYTGLRSKATWDTWASNGPWCVPYAPRCITLRGLHCSRDFRESLDIHYTGDGLEASIKAKTAAEVVSCLGLFFLAHKKLGERPGGLQSQSLIPDNQQYPQVLHTDFPADVQRAMDMLRMRNFLCSGNTTRSTALNRPILYMARDTKIDCSNQHVVRSHIEPDRRCTWL